MITMCKIEDGSEEVDTGEWVVEKSTPSRSLPLKRYPDRGSVGL